MKITFSAARVAWLCFAWAFLILLGITMGINVPFILAVIGTVLLLFTFTKVSE